MAQYNSSEPYHLARDRYSELGIDTDAALDRLASISLSLHCWQGDDLGGFETKRHSLCGGIEVTGDYPGKARNPDELRIDLEKVFSFLPGRHRLNLHASYGEFSGQDVDRDEIEAAHFRRWIDWAGEHGLGLDFNPTYYAHPKASAGLTLTHPDAGIRDFWIEHGKRSRRIAAVMGESLGSACITNSWIPDGYKDLPADRAKPRERLTASLDEIFRERFDDEHQLDSVECKLFGIGSESYVAGSHEYYLGYAMSRNKLLCLDAGHFHPTETIADKISSVMQWIPEILLHVSRGVRWDSDHVVILNDELLSIAQELVRGDFLDRSHIGLDFFDASINRIAAWTIGTRAMIKALLIALLEPSAKLRQYEREGDFTRRLALMEEIKMLPFGAVWDHYCERSGVPVGISWMDEVQRYEADVLSQRSGSSTVKVRA